MARSVSATINASFQCAVKNTLDGQASSRSGSSMGGPVSPAQGSADAGLNSAWFDESRSLTDDGTGTDTETLDIEDFASASLGVGNGLDAVGLAMSHEDLLGLYIENLGPGILLVGGEGSANAFDDLFDGDADAVLKIPAGSKIALVTAGVAAAFAVNGTGLLKFESKDGQGAVEYKVGLIFSSQA